MRDKSYRDYPWPNRIVGGLTFALLIAYSCALFLYYSQTDQQPLISRDPFIKVKAFWAASEPVFTDSDDPNYTLYLDIFAKFGGSQLFICEFDVFRFGNRFLSPDCRVLLQRHKSRAPPLFL